MLNYLNNRPFNEMNLKNKIIVITGGTGVLGSCMARALLNAGAKVVILGRTLVKAQKLEKELGNHGEIYAVTADVCNETSIRNAQNQIHMHFGKVDILINGAGGNHPDATTAHEYFKENDGLQSFFDLDNENLRNVFDLNFMGSLIPTKVFAKDMVGRKGCSIVNISSVSSFNPLTKVIAYGGAKAAINHLTQWLSVYFAKIGIRVNAIVPGFFLTEQNRILLTNKDGSYTERATKIMSQTPMGRFGEPEDLLSTLFWLCDPTSEFVTGVVVPVDGGFTAYSGV